MPAPLTSVVAALLAALLVACNAGPQERARVVDDKDVPFGLLDPSASPIVTRTSQPTTRMELCFLRNRRLVVVDVMTTGNPTLLQTVRALASPAPTGGASVLTAVTDPSVVRDVRLRGGIARVDLRQRVGDRSGEDQLYTVAQIVCTLTARPGVGQVSFTLEGTPVEVPRADGSLVSDPVSRDDYASLMA